MKQITLTQGKSAIVDNDDYKWLIVYNWYYRKDNRGYGGYAGRSQGNKKILMHREILNTPDGYSTDHINGDTLDNRKTNLRICTQHQNLGNQGAPRHNTSGHKGVYFNKERRKWQAQIKVYKETIYLGRFLVIEDAIEAYRLASEKYFESFSRID